VLGRYLRQCVALLFPIILLTLTAAAQGGLSNGVMQSGTIGPNATVNYTFSAPAHAVMFSTISGGTASEPIFTEQIDNTTGIDSGYSNVRTQEYGGISAPAASYTISLKRTDSNSGQENFTITNVVVPDAGSPPSADEEGGLMQNETPLSGSVTYGDADVYWFDANASDPNLNVEIDYTAGAKPTIYLVASDGGISINSINTSSTQFNVYDYNNPAGRLYLIVAGSAGTSQSYQAILHNSTAEPAGQVGKSLGGHCAACEAALEQQGSTGTLAVGDPINPSSGNVFETVVDYTTAGQNPLALIRYYNSAGNQQSSPYAASLGTNWRTNYDRYLHIVSSSVVTAERPDGQILTFRLSGATWKPDTDTDFRLTTATTGGVTTWTLTDHNDLIETYAQTGSQGWLATIATPAGYTQTLAYSGSLLSSVTDSYSRALNFSHSGNYLSGVTTPDTLQLTYQVTPVSGQGRLTSVGYNTSPATSQTYLYEDASFPFALTGITDESGNRYATWGYDSQGRGISSQLAGGADATSVSYAADGMSATVTRPLGIEETLKFKPLQDVEKIVEIDRHDPNGTVPDAVETLAYDANGYLSQVVDWNGEKTIYTNNNYGEPVYIYEANGSPVARTTSISYDSHWPRKLYQVYRGGLVTQFNHETATGNLLSKVLTDEARGYGSYAPSTRTWHYTYTSTGQLLTVQSPRTDATVTTSYAYTGGTLTSITNPAGQVTTINLSTPGGLPLKVTDPNGVVTTITYTPRNWLSTSSVATAGGARLTSYTYNPTGKLTKLQQPDGSYLSFTFDNAHRLMKIVDALGNTKTFTLNAAGKATAIASADAGGTVRYQHADTFDSLGRVLVDTDGASLAKSFTYDPDGNALTITDADGHPATVQQFDALNRVSQINDPASGVTKFTYDPYSYFNRLASITTPNGAKTSFSSDGYGWLYYQSSPDSGTLYLYRDGDGNLTKKVDALNVTTNFTNDVLGRRTSMTFPAATSENVTYTFDQAGHGFGIGRLTSMIDMSGTLSRSYDERGNLTVETRVRPGGLTRSTGYSYDAASNIASITYPSGAVVTQTRNAAGLISALSLKPTSGGAAQTVVSSTSLYPFGPDLPGHFGNGTVQSWSLDTAYRVGSVATTKTGGNVTSLAYTLDNDGNVTAVTDGVNSANNQTLTYDNLDHLLTAAGSYGSEVFTYDPNGNRKTLNGTTYAYTANSNKLTSIGGVATTENANGSLTAYNGAGFTYYNSGRLKTSTSGGSTVLSYQYDGFGHRIEKVDSAERFIYYDQAARLMEETDNTGSFARDYIYLNGVPVATFLPNGSTGTLSFLHVDRVGRPVAATDASQNVGWSFSNADPFGTGTPAVGTIANDLRFPGQEGESTVALNYNGNRDYAPTFGRYIESDPIGLNGGQASTYAYAGGNPLRLVDPYGLQMSYIPPASEPAPIEPSSEGSERKETLENAGDRATSILQSIIDKANNADVEKAVNSGNYNIDSSALSPEDQQKFADAQQRDVAANSGSDLVCTLDKPMGAAPGDPQETTIGPYKTPTYTIVVTPHTIDFLGGDDQPKFDRRVIQNAGIQ
jgi:RHS repeat-associated protein